MFVIADLLIFTLLNTGNKVSINNYGNEKKCYFNTYTSNTNNETVDHNYNKDIIDVEFESKS